MKKVKNRLIAFVILLGFLSLVNLMVGSSLKEINHLEVFNTTDTNIESVDSENYNYINQNLDEEIEMVNNHTEQNQTIPTASPIIYEQRFDSNSQQFLLPFSIISATFIILMAIVIVFKLLKI